MKEVLLRSRPGRDLVTDSRGKKKPQPDKQTGAF
jgi:hypothetical protein